jgi:hypothetical protein
MVDSQKMLEWQEARREADLKRQQEQREADRKWHADQKEREDKRQDARDKAVRQWQLKLAFLAAVLGLLGGLLSRVLFPGDSPPARIKAPLTATQGVRWAFSKAEGSPRKALPVATSVASAPGALEARAGRGEASARPCSCRLIHRNGTQRLGRRW